MKRVHTLIIGGGQAGLAMSRCLWDRGVDHVVLERGRLAERWRSERWDSLRLLTPNWQTRLPGWSYRGPEPDGYMRAAELTSYLEDYARSWPVPLHTNTTVLCVRPAGGGYDVLTDQEHWRAANVVVATGACGAPHVPAMAASLPADIQQFTPSSYRNPDQLPSGAVLVVGASASGVQLAEELHASGRPVLLCVGRHNRMPRRYRGLDIMWWLDRMGTLTRPVRDGDARDQPSLQLAGRPDRADLDLPRLQSAGVKLLGRLRGIDGRQFHVADDLHRTVAEADAKLHRLRARIDRYIDRNALGDLLPEADPVASIRPDPAPSSVDLQRAGIRSVVWATGFVRSYPWLQVPVLDARGEVIHAGGITPAPGLFILGLKFMRRRNSTYIDGVGLDARDLAEHITADRHRHRPLAEAHAA